MRVSIHIARSVLEGTSRYTILLARSQNTNHQPDQIDRKIKEQDP